MWILMRRSSPVAHYHPASNVAETRTVPAADLWPCPSRETDEGKNTHNESQIRGDKVRVVVLFFSASLTKNRPWPCGLWASCCLTRGGGAGVSWPVAIIGDLCRTTSLIWYVFIFSFSYRPLVWNHVTIKTWDVAAFLKPTPHLLLKVEAQHKSPKTLTELLAVAWPCG